MPLLNWGKNFPGGCTSGVACVIPCKLLAGMRGFRREWRCWGMVVSGGYYGMVVCLAVRACRRVACVEAWVLELVAGV